MRFLQDHNYREARFGVCLLGLLTLSLLAGCGGGGGGSNGNPTTGAPTTGTTNTGSNTVGTSTGTNTGGTTPLSVSGVTATGLTATLTEASATVGVGGNLVYTLTLTNSTGAALPVRATGDNTPSALLTVTNPAGSISFQPIPGSPPLVNGSLAPGQSFTKTVSATGFTSAGVYSASATFGDDPTGAVKSVGPLTVTVQ